MSKPSASRMALMTLYHSSLFHPFSSASPGLRHSNKYVCLVKMGGSLKIGIIFQIKKMVVFEWMYIILYLVCKLIIYGSKGSTDPFPPVPPLCAEQLAAATLLVESIAGDENQAVFGRQPCQVPEAHGKHGKARPGWRQDFFWPSPGMFFPNAASIPSLFAAC